MRALLLTLVLLAGCGFLPSDSTTFQAPMERNGETVTVTLVDEAGLVTEMVGGAPPLPEENADPPYAWNANGRPTEVALYWMSDSCSHEPLLRLTGGNALTLDIDLNRGEEACDAMGLGNFVTLSLNRAIDATAVDLVMLP
jgi:hypothetical protein